MTLTYRRVVVSGALFISAFTSRDEWQRAVAYIADRNRQRRRERWLDDTRARDRDEFDDRDRYAPRLCARPSTHWLRLLDWSTEVRLYLSPESRRITSAAWMQIIASSDYTEQRLYCSSLVVTFFNHNFVNCKATLILAIKIYEIKYNISLNDVHT